MGWAFQFAPTGAFTLEANVIFSDYTTALAYAKTDPTAVLGKVISVNSGEQKGVYMIEAVGENGSLKKVGSDINTDQFALKSDLTSVYKFKGTVSTYAELPTEGVQSGDVYNVNDSGKNYVWIENFTEGQNGWDDLGGIVDLSPYAKTETVNGQIATLEGSIATNTGAISTINANLNNKVDKVEGSSLISSEKLELIDANAQAIVTLQQKDTAIENRLSVVEGFFEGTDEEGNPIGLGTINSQLTAHDTRLTELENKDVERLQQIGGLYDFKTTTEQTIAGIVQLNTEQSTLISNLSTDLGTANGLIAGNTSSITNLTTTVNGHTGDIASIRQSINGLAVKSVASNELVLAADSNGVLSTTLGIKSYKDNIDGKTYVALTGIGGDEVDRFDASAFVMDGMIDTITYNAENQSMLIIWNDDSGKSEEEKSVEIPLSGLVDTYTAGTGLVVENNVFSARLSTDTNNKLTVDAQGALLVDLSTTIENLEATMDEKIADAFAWIDVDNN